MLHLRQKLTVRAHGRTLVLVKRPVESAEHVLQKALLWAMYLPAYPTVRVEVPFPGSGRYKPDLLALDERGAALFWGECGAVSLEKLRSLLARHRSTHFALSRWAERLDPFAAIVERALGGVRRSAPVELLGFPAGADAWIAPGGEIEVRPAEVALRRWDGSDSATARARPRR